MSIFELQKAFDTVNHDFFKIKKMEFIGFSEEKTELFKFYLSNKKFKFHVKNKFSEPGNLLCGVPQGTIYLGRPFLLYTNDMPQAVDCALLLYADDTCVIFQHKDITKIKAALNKNFSMLCDWFIDNKLSIHFGGLVEITQNQFWFAAIINLRNQSHCTSSTMTLKSSNILNTTQKMKFSMKDLFSKCDQIRSFLWIWSHLLQKFFMENFLFLCSESHTLRLHL